MEPEAPEAIEASASALVINEVYELKATTEVGCYIFDCNVTVSGQTFDTEQMYRPNDPYGDPAFTQWLIDNPDFPITPYTPPPPLPYSLSISTVWERMTDPEAEAFDTAMATASPLRLRKMFNTSTSMMSDSELFTFVEGVMAPLFTASRVDALLAQ